MKRYYFNKNEYLGNNGPFILCNEPCAVMNNGTKIGSVACQECKHHLANNKNDVWGISWIECEKIEEATDNE